MKYHTNNYKNSRY